MRILKKIITFVLVLIILGGTGYLIWSYYNMNNGMLGKMMPNMPNMNNAQQNKESNANTSESADKTKPLNILAVENKDRLAEITTTINEAISQITIDPYSKVIVPGTAVPNTNAQKSQGNTTVNIYPNSNVPAGTPQQPAANTNTPAGNYVYDQSKLEQLHNGIFKLSQGMMLLSGLNDDLTMQASTTESGSNYDRYVLRYNTALQNRMKLNSALTMINDGSALINVNPYGSNAGYQYNAENMQKLHNGIYKLAQGMLSGSKFSQELTNQMAQANMLINSTNSTLNMNTAMNMNTTSRFGNLTFIFTGVLIIMVIGFFIGLIGSAMQILKPKAR